MTDDSVEGFMTGAEGFTKASSRRHKGFHDWYRRLHKGFMTGVEDFMTVTGDSAEGSMTVTDDWCRRLHDCD